MTLKSFPLSLLLSFVLSFLSLALAFNESFLSSSEFFALESGAQEAILRVVYDEALTEFLDQYPNWSANAYADNETQWHVDFYDGEDWVGNAHIDFSTDQLFEVYLVKDLSPEAYALGKEKLEQLISSDAEILAIIGDLKSWNYDISYNKWESRWQAWFDRNIETVAINFDEYDERFYVGEIYDPYAFTAEEQEELERNKAIELAYSAEGIDEALNGVENWHTYAEPLGENLWGVEFGGEERYFYAVVNIDSEEITETSTR